MTAAADTSVTPGRAKRREAVDGRLVEALLAGNSWRDAATLAGCSHATVARRMRDPEFRGLLAALRSDTLRQVSDELVSGATEAVQCLRAVMADSEAPTGARVGAAGRLLDVALRWHDALNVDQRLADLEALAQPRLAAIDGRWGA